MYWQCLWAKEKVTWSQPQYEDERQQSINDFGCCIFYNPRAVLRRLSVINVLAAFIGNMVNVNITTPDNQHQLSINTASTQRQQCVNRVSTILGIATWVIQGLFCGIYL